MPVTESLENVLQKFPERLSGCSGLFLRRQAGEEAALHCVSKGKSAKTAVHSVFKFCG